MLSQAGIEVVEFYMDNTSEQKRAALNLYNGKDTEKVTDICVPDLNRILEFRRDATADYHVSEALG